MTTSLFATFDCDLQRLQKFGKSFWKERSLSPSQFILVKVTVKKFKAVVTRLLEEAILPSISLFCSFNLIAILLLQSVSVKNFTNFRTSVSFWLFFLYTYQNFPLFFSLGLYISKTNCTKYVCLFLPSSVVKSYNNIFSAFVSVT